MKTAQELIKAWDEGRTIPTIEMGGLGPGYEQCIQIAAVEFTRATLDFKDTGNRQEDWDRFDVLYGEVLKKIDDDLGGMTGAQYGAAKNLAWNWVHIGPEAFVEKYKAAGEGKRAIICSKHWPKVPS